MNLTLKQQTQVVKTALTYLGTPYEKNFTCADFVRAVYREIEIEIPILSTAPVPQWMNITRDELEGLPVGHLMFLRHKKNQGPRSWTHVVITLPERKCIHCSYFFGGKVVISSLVEIFEVYDFAPSEPV